MPDPFGIPSGSKQPAPESRSARYRSVTAWTAATAVAVVLVLGTFFWVMHRDDANTAVNPNTTVGQRTTADPPATAPPRATTDGQTERRNDSIGSQQPR